LSVSADAAFESAANAAVAAFVRRPPYISYAVDVRVRAQGAPETLESRTVVVRTADDLALISTAGAKKPETDFAYPLPPEVDALAQWAFDFRIGADGVRMAIAYVRPKEYRITQAVPNADVVVSSVAGYRISYAADAGHVHLEPATQSVREFAAGIDHMIYRDVWYDQTTFLPSRVVLAGAEDTLDLQYRVVNGYWLLDRFTYLTAVGTRGAKRTYAIDAVYREYAFPPAVAGL
jgi:hypothetical protein